MKRKKGQMEMIGLVIIVILITLGLLFLAQLALKSKPEKKIFTRKGLAYSTMSTLMKTNLDCSGRSLQVGSQLIEDCAQYESTRNIGFSSFSCENKHSCVFLEEEITGLLGKTLGEWNKNYVFESRLLITETDSRELIIVGEGNCPGERDTSGPFPIKLRDGGLVENILYLCD